MARVLRKRTAFTLAELLLALGLTVVAVLSAIELGISAYRSNQKGADLMLANGLATEYTEQFVYSLPAVTDTFWSTAQTGVYNTTIVPQNGATLGNSTFYSNVYLQDLTAVQPGLKMVLVNVSWGSGVQGQTGYGQQAVQVTRLIYGH